jgi:signal peptidase I
VSDKKEPAATEGTAPETATAHPSALRQILEFILTLAIAYFIAQGVRAWVIEPFVVPTGSMLPTIQLSDQVLANKFVYRFSKPQRGDIVVLDDPDGRVDTLIKRVIAVGGQTVDLRDGMVVVDGQTLSESYTHGLRSDPIPRDDAKNITYPIAIPADSIWVMGDNRTSSQDSRYFGPVPLSNVHGRAFFIYWPWSRIGPLH